jgi:hypothetical protein
MVRWSSCPSGLDQYPHSSKSSLSEHPPIILGPARRTDKDKRDGITLRRG